MSETRVYIHVQGSSGAPLAGALVSGVPKGSEGSWQALTNSCGDLINPVDGLPGVVLTDDTYQVTVSHPTGQTRQLPITIAGPGDPIRIGLQPLPFPPAPSRDAICRVRVGFQGVTVSTKQFGAFPAFGPETTTLNDEDLISYCQQCRAAGFTHSEIAVSWQYIEADYAYPVPGADLSQNLPELLRRIQLMITQGGMLGVLVFMAGDGRSVTGPDGSYVYNDPQGHTYGFDWLMVNLKRILTALTPVKPYVVIVPGYDGVFYGWGAASGEPPTPDLQPTRIANFGKLFRSLWPDGYLALEHSGGNLPLGSGASDYITGGPLDPYDVILSEFSSPPNDDKFWQIAPRLNGPAYVRPPDQPGGDDPTPPWDAAPPTTRGPRYTCAYEFGTYPWVRSKASAATIQQWREYLGRYGGYSTVC